MTLSRRLTAEGVGTALLLATVVGSGIMGDRLAGGNTAIALLANTLATGAGLVALILTFGPISGAHFNTDVGEFILSQLLGAICATALFRWLIPTLPLHSTKVIVSHAENTPNGSR